MEVVPSPTSLYSQTADAYISGLVLTAKDYPEYFAALAEDILIPVDDAQTDPRTCKFKDGYLKPLGIASMMDAPIRIQGKTIGVLCCEHIGEMRQWDQLEQEFATSVEISLRRPAFAPR